MNIKNLMMGIAVATVMTGCGDNYLDIENPNFMSDATFWSTEEDMDNAMRACYGTMFFQGIYAQWYDLVFEMRGDLAYNESGWRDYAMFSKFLFPSSNWECVTYCWNHYYQGINAVNQFLAHIDDESIKMDAEKRSRYKGEASWLRALYYYNLYHLYGEKIAVLTEPSGGVIFPENGTYEKVWSQIESDLWVAINSDLPDKWDISNAARVSKNAAYAMLGKACMQQHKWSDAEEAFSHVIGEYRLTDEYFDNFDLDHEFNSESIFEVNFTSDSKVYSDHWTAYGTPNSPSTSMRSLYWAPRNGANGYGDALPNGAYLAEFDKDEYGAKTVDGKVDPRKDASLCWKRSQSLYGKQFGALGGSTQPYMTPLIWTRKYCDGVDQSILSEPGASSINFRIIRYADILLLMAEALNEQGKTGDAYQYIDEVRTRKSVNLVPLADIRPGLNKEKMRDQIEHERIVELGGESVRWFDIMRWGYLDDEEGKQHLLKRDYEFEAFRPGIDKFLPIPQREIDLNPNFQPNVGW